MSALAGTFDYVAPEVFHGEKEKFGPTIDTYSLGLALYRLLSKEQLSDEFNTNRFKGNPLPPLEDVDKPLCDIINLACSYEPERRYPSPSFMKEDIQNYLEGKPIFGWKPFFQKTERMTSEPPSSVDKPPLTPDDKTSQQSDLSTRPLFPKWLMIVIPLVVVFIAAGCWFALTQGPHTVDVTEIRVNPPSLAMTVGDGPFQLSATVLPEDATNQAVTWSSDNPDAASVSVIDGLVTANGPGTATITAESGDCTVTVALQPAPEIAPQEVILNPPSLTITVGDEPFQLDATVLPENATNQAVTWSSDNPDAASVSNGLVTANGTGTATITAKSGDCTATCTVTVAPPPSTAIEVTEIRVNPTSLAMTVEDEPFQLSATVLPENATNRTVTWSSSNSSVASVDNGFVTAHQPGTATITAKSGDYTATCAVTVSPKSQEVIEVEKVLVNPTSLEMTIGEVQLLNATVSPENATNQEISWSSSESSVASVSGGLVKANGTGRATITAKNGNYKATCAVTVVPIAVTGIRVNPTSLGMMVGEEQRLSATVLPENATNQEVSWSSNKPSVASVSGGLVKATGEGDAIITAKSGAYQATCDVKVSPAPPTVIEVTEVRLNRTSAEMKSGGGPLQLSATVLPENATNRTVTWSSSNPAVVTVNQEGVVTAIDTGEATVAASCGGKSASCKISVIIPVERVSIANISDNWLEMNRGKQKTLTANVFPSNATDSKVTWNSDNASVATINADGVLTGVGKGRATITASAGGQSDSFTVAVIVPVTGVTLNSNSISLANGENRVLTATVTPSDANDATVTWTTTNSSVARVANGTVTGAGDGTATITAQAGGIKAYCTVQVTTRWSDWMDAYPNVSAPKQQRTVYQYIEKRKETTTSSSPSLDGYTRTGSTTETGEPSAWTDSVIYPSDFLQVETQQVTDVEGHTEYRYGRWFGAGGRCWCKEYGEERSGGTYVEQYTDWMTTRGEYRDSGLGDWRCGKTNAQHQSHKGVDHIDSDGYPAWKRYFIGEDYYFWEETRWVDTTYKTQYRSRPVSVIYFYERWVESSRSAWTTEWREVDNISSERQEKTQYRYMIT